jgi:hypothetical protein
VTVDEVYGQDPALRAELARCGLGYVLAIPKRHLITTGIGPRTAIELAKRLPARAWQRMPAGPGAKGPRWYDWALIEAADPSVPAGSGPHWLLVRRSIGDGGALPDGTPVIISGSTDGTVRVRRTADGTPVAPPLYLPESVRAIAVHGNVIITAAGADIAAHQPALPRPIR